MVPHRLDVPRRALGGGRRALLEFRGINYEADVYLNGVSLTQPWKGMFLRRQIDVTDVLRPGGSNVLAVLVTPPDPPGDPKIGYNPADFLSPWGSNCQSWGGRPCVSVPA